MGVTVKRNPPACASNEAKTAMPPKNFARRKSLILCQPNTNRRNEHRLYVDDGTVRNVGRSRIRVEREAFKHIGLLTSLTRG